MEGSKKTEERSMRAIIITVFAAILMLFCIYVAGDILNAKLLLRIIISNMILGLSFFYFIDFCGIKLPENLSKCKRKFANSGGIIGIISWVIGALFIPLSSMVLGDLPYIKNPEAVITLKNIFNIITVIIVSGITYQFIALLITIKFFLPFDLKQGKT